MIDCFNSPVGKYFGPEWQHLWDIMARYLAVLNSSINFIVYCVADKKFRCILGNFFQFRTDFPRMNIEEVCFYFLIWISFATPQIETHFVEDKKNTQG